MSLLLFLMYFFNVMAAISILFFRKKQVGSTLAWLLVFAFIPWLGFLLYFFLGSTRKLQLFRRRFRPNPRLEEYGPSREENAQALLAMQPGSDGQGPEEYRDLMLLNLQGAGAVYTQGNDAHLLVDAEKKYTSLFRDIEEAKETIHVLYFIFKTRDESGKQLLDLLVKKAREGVKVRVIYDTLGCLKTHKSDFDPLLQAGGMVYGYLPSPLRTLLQVNYRMHRKMVIIDGKVAYTGGINIGDDYLGKDKRITPWRDTSVRLSGPCVQQIQRQFIKDWVFLDSQAARPYAEKIDSFQSMEGCMKEENAGQAGVQIVSSGPDSLYPYTKESYLGMITRARRYLYIQTPYFIPDDALLTALRCARRAGVDVRLMIPGVPDKAYAYHVTMWHAGEMLRWGIPVYRYPGFLHAKTFVMDDMVASVGSTNLDIRSFDLDYELNALVYDRDFAIECRQVFLRDQENSRRLTQEEYHSRPLSDKVKAGLLRLVAPLL